MRGDFDTRRQQEEARREANEQLTTFYANNSMAQVHEAAINNILQRFPNETLDTAWLKVQLYAQKNGLSLDRPLNEQQRQGQQNEGRRPMNLRGNRNVNGGGERETAPEFANPNDRWADIISGEMRRAGYQLNR
jgi:hypothetical protein